MKKIKPEKLVFGIGGLLLFVAASAALVDFDQVNPRGQALGKDAPKNPWQEAFAPAQKGGGDQGNAAGPANIALQNPGQQNQGRFLAQQARVNKELIKTIRLSEAHWQGMELMELTTEKKMKFRYPLELTGLMVDEVTLNAVLSGVVGGDVLQTVDGTPVNDLRQFQELTRKLQNRPRAKLTVWRRGQVKKFTMKVEGALGLAQMESAPMILPGDPRPHPWRGPCTDCHLIGESVTIMPDPDGVILPPPAIQVGAQRPHRDRGPCEACHVIVE